ncbi:MAG: acetyl-CoA hydrolase [Hydrocarboniphaga sp.]|uniref:acetyl-CoA hydrolase/transferase family protein n=1 Tax=Hydrocarboniphaga sp. TaxID=2033016 RepID=UPI00262B2354|nr:acetyl-CoA hydrolase/transferase C-terminal domain-containing protein [Hydrocarboniphaga sp.]MDB5969104.1 acetyl-CoA hydrolase [Hydrocarboniphaga sp.]
MPQQVSVKGLLNSLESGETAFIAGSAGEPVELTQVLVDDAECARGVCFVSSFVPGINGRNLASQKAQRRMRVFFMQPAFRQARELGLIDFSPMNYFGIQQHLLDMATPLDSVIVQVSEPDAAGLCSLGPAVEFMPGLLLRAKRILAVINPNVPDVAGAPRIAMDAFHSHAHSTAPLAQYDAGRSNETAERIAAHLATLIPNGATLQLGLGKVPSLLLPALSGHRDLAFHSGMLSDSILGLIDSGVLRIDRPLMTTVVAGSEQLYQKLPGLRALELAGVDHTHDPLVLGRLSKLHAINSAIEVDLLGQVNAETVDGRYVSGPGGLPDFAYAAHRQTDGLSVIALPASDPAGRHSRIVPRLKAGTPLSIPQHDVDAVVTEYGIARLRGVALDERMQRLIAIAHPDHRDTLRAAARERLANT